MTIFFEFGFFTFNLIRSKKYLINVWSSFTIDSNSFIFQVLTAYQHL